MSRLREAQTCLEQAMAHLKVAISDVATSVNPQQKRVVIDLADKQVAEAWSIIRKLTVADPDTLIITKVDGEWPTSAIAAFEYAFEGDESDFGIVELCTQILDALLEGQP